jgi:N-acetylneuraminic acid mutarotase
MRKPQLSYVLIFILLALPPMSLAEEDTWTRKTDMPTRTWGLSTSVVNGKIYAIGGGSESASGQKFSTVEEYDPMMDAWTRKADMPTRRWGLSTSVVNGKIYAIGGSKENSQEALSNTEEYDPVANTWDVKADMPTPRSRIPTCVVDGKIYVIGGHDAHNGRSFANVEVYDPEIDEWTERSDMPTARGGLSTSVVDGKIYAMGGYIWEMGRIISVVEEYNPATDTWTTKAPMPRVRGGHSAVVVNGKIYLIGGNGELDFRGPKVAVVDVYDPATGTWTTKADLPTVRVYAGTSMVNGYIYVIGGSNYFSGVPSSGGALSTVEEYDTGLGIQVSSISPQEGPVTGGQDIAIIGRRLRSGLMVTIGGNPLRELNITDALITGITPPGTDGEQDILIFISDLDESVFVGTFFYNLPSSIVAIGITPTNGKQAGGDLGSINGSGFLPGALVAIGGVPATGIGVTPTIITFTIPSGTEGVK